MAQYDCCGRDGWQSIYYFVFRFYLFDQAHSRLCFSPIRNDPILYPQTIHCCSNIKWWNCACVTFITFAANFFFTKWNYVLLIANCYSTQIRNHMANKSYLLFIETVEEKNFFFFISNEGRKFVLQFSTFLIWPIQQNKTE